MLIYAFSDAIREIYRQSGYYLGFLPRQPEMAVLQVLPVHTICKNSNVTHVKDLRKIVSIRHRIDPPREIISNSGSLL